MREGGLLSAVKTSEWRVWGGEDKGDGDGTDS